MNGAKIRRKKKDRVREDMKKHVYFFFFLDSITIIT